MLRADVNETPGSGSVAWLRFVREEDGSGVRAGLFQTTPDGAPAGFRFTRVQRETRSPLDDQEALSGLVKALLSGLDPCPVLVLALAEETRRGPRIDEYLLSGSSFCRIVEGTGLAQDDGTGRPREVLPDASAAVDEQTDAGWRRL